MLSAIQRISQRVPQYSSVMSPAVRCLRARVGVFFVDLNSLNYWYTSSTREATFFLFLFRNFTMYFENYLNFLRDYDDNSDKLIFLNGLHIMYPKTSSFIFQIDDCAVTIRVKSKMCVFFFKFVAFSIRDFQQ